MSKIRNFTPHVINVVSGPDFESEGVARCSQTEILIGEIDGVKITRQAYGEVVGLPEAEDGTFIIVSRLVAEACPNRSDLLIPGPLVRDADGKPLGCKGFSIV